MSTKQTGSIVAIAVGALFASAAFADAMTSTTTTTSTAGVKCIGANACKGQTACKSATNSCKGQNSCKGTGWMMATTDKECTDKGGKVDTSATPAN